MPYFFRFKPTAYDCGCCENDSPLPNRPARWVFAPLCDFCCNWNCIFLLRPLAINVGAYTAPCSRMRLLHPYSVSFQATISRQFISSLFLFRCGYVTFVFCVCPSGNEVIGVDSAEVRASVQYLHIIDNQQTLFELSHKLEPRAWEHWRRTSQCNMLHVCKITGPAEAPTGLWGA